MSAFCFIDKIVEINKGHSVTAIFKLKGSEEFLKDHFESFPVMPGVLLLEALKQAAVRLLTDSDNVGSYFRLLGAEEIKFGQFVKPGTELKIEAKLVRTEDLRHFFEGRIDFIGSSDQTSRRKALSANFVLEPVTS